MANVEQAQASVETFLIDFNIPKTGKTFSFDCDPDKLPKHIWVAIVRAGIEHFASRGLSKIVVKGLEGDELEAARDAATEVVERNVEAMYAGDMRVPGGPKKGKITGKIKTRAKQKALRVLKAQAKAEGERVSDYTNKEWTLMAEQFLEENQDIIQEAREEIEKEEKEVKEKGYIKTDAAGKIVKSKWIAGMKKDPKRVAANEAKRKNPGAPRKRGEARVHA